MLFVLYLHMLKNTVALDEKWIQMDRKRVLRLCSLVATDEVWMFVSFVFVVFIHFEGCHRKGSEFRVACEDARKFASDLLTYSVCETTVSVESLWSV